MAARRVKSGRGRRCGGQEGGTGGDRGFAHVLRGDAAFFRGDAGVDRPGAGGESAALAQLGADAVHDRAERTGGGTGRPERALSRGGAILVPLRRASLHERAVQLFKCDEQLGAREKGGGREATAAGGGGDVLRESFAPGAGGD